MQARAERRKLRTAGSAKVAAEFLEELNDEARKRQALIERLKGLMPDSADIWTDELFICPNSGEPATFVEHERVQLPRALPPPTNTTAGSKQSAAQQAKKHGIPSALNDNNLHGREVDSCL